jgi:excisionase family DNA binding protein
MDTPTSFRVSEILPIIRLSRSAVYAKLHRNEIPGAYRIGKSWRINKEEFLNEIKRRSRQRTLQSRTLASKTLASKTNTSVPGTSPQRGRHGISD